MDKINSRIYPNYNIALKGNDNNELPNKLSENKTIKNNTEYMTSDISSASRAYGLSFVNKNKTIPQMSMKDMVIWLESQGKVEGVDFDIDSTYTCGNTLVVLRNKQGQEELVVHYDGGNHSSWSGYEVKEYKNGEKYKEISRDCNGNIRVIEQSFKNDDVAVQHLFENGLTYDSTPQDYLRQLQENNMKYSIEYSGEEDDNRSVNIDVFYDDNKLDHSVWFYYGNNKFDEHCEGVCRTEFNDKQELYRQVCFNKDNVDVVTYVNYNE